MSRVVAGLVQLRTSEDEAHALAHALQWVGRAADAGAELILTPETCNLMTNDRERLGRLTDEANSPFLTGMAALARRRAVWLLLGSVAVRTQGGRLANRSILLDPDGVIVARYDKIHLFDIDLADGRRWRESERFVPGDAACVASTPWGGLGLTICYDVRFPELHRDLALSGAAMIAAPAAFTRPTGEAHWLTLLRARAIETGAFVLAPAQGGRHSGGAETWGRSVVFGPWGETVALVEDDQPGVLLAELELGAVDRARAAIPALCHRRPYRLPRSDHS